jgi:hypothetical protein
VKIANGCWLVVMMFYLGKEHFWQKIGYLDLVLTPTEPFFDPKADPLIPSDTTSGLCLARGGHGYWGGTPGLAYS